jgi:hypothetical protein
MIRVALGALLVLVLCFVAAMCWALFYPVKPRLPWGY